MKLIDKPAFRVDVQAIIFDSQDLVSNYNDHHAPSVTRIVTDRPSAPWLTPQVREARRRRRQAETQWGKTGLEVHRQIFISEREKVKALFLNERQMFVSQRIADCL